jgi:peptide/nickel transport system permease protein
MGSVRDVLLAPQHAVTRRLIAAADLRSVNAAATTNISSKIVR